MRGAILAAVLCLGLAGCQTTYGEMGATGGVKAEQVGYDRYRITALINSYTPVPLLADYLKLKAAETTLAAGSRYFVALDLQDGTMVNTYNSPGVVNVIGGTAIYQPPSSNTVVSPQAFLTIQIVRNGKARPSNAIDAKEIVETIGPRLRKGR